MRLPPVTERRVRDEAVALLQELVRAPSPNPPGDERLAAAVARAYLEQMPGALVEDVGVAPERPMLIARLDGKRPGREIVFAGHLDTVPAGEGWTRDPFGGEVKDGPSLRAWGERHEERDRRLPRGHATARRGG